MSARKKIHGLYPCLCASFTPIDGQRLKVRAMAFYLDASPTDGCPQPLKLLDLEKRLVRAYICSDAPDTKTGEVIDLRASDWSFLYKSGYGYLSSRQQIADLILAPSPDWPVGMETLDGFEHVVMVCRVLEGGVGDRLLRMLTPVTP